MAEEREIGVRPRESIENMQWIRDSLAWSEKEHERIAELLKRSRKRLEALTRASGRS
jgi:hypothetical protein